MGKREDEADRRLEEYVERLSSVIGHADRVEPMIAYLTGLLLPGKRKSVEPMAAKVDPRHASARHQSMHHFVANSPWDEQEVLSVARDYALVQLERHAPIGAWVIDDTSVPKKGNESVGVARQYCGALGKRANCQVAVSISLANNVMSIPAGYRLYLPKSWTDKRQRCRRVGVPKQIEFKKKWQIALEQIGHLIEEMIPLAPVVADAGYGVITDFRDGVTAKGLSYAVGITESTTVWPPGMAPLPPAPRTRKGGRAPALLRRTANHKPLPVSELAKSLPRKAWRNVHWREGVKGAMKSRFAMVRVRAAHRDTKRREPRPLEWLLVEWPRGEKKPTKFWLSSVPEDVSIEELVGLVKIRWRIERDYQEMKDELGLDHYEGRGWRGFHHHGVLCIAAYAFLIAERARLSPPEALAFLHAPDVPEGFSPRGSPTTS